MYIGEILRERMELFGFDVEQLSEEALVEKSLINNILNNKIDVEEIDEIDLEFIARTLYTTSNYFLDKNERDKDMLNVSLNRGISDKKTNIIKAKLQQFANDFVFIKEILAED